MDVTTALLDSWDRQCRIVVAMASLIDDSNRHVKPSEDGWPLDLQLAHIHGVRRFWLSHVSPARAEQLVDAVEENGETALRDLGAIRSCLDASGKAVREAVSELIAGGNQPIITPNVRYDNPILFLQHMIWHEGWHVGLITLGLRLNGQEPTDEWSEKHVWGEWRTETW
jgi:uncharacterized damage-inducible protein DinB